MKRLTAIIFLLILCFSCNAQDQRRYTFEEFQTEFKNAYSHYLIPLGTYFWDEFKNIEGQYNISKEEAKLLGEWMNVIFSTSMYNSYYFFPNKLFLLKFFPMNVQVENAEETYFDKGIGTWEIVNGIVKLTIHAIVTEDRTKERPNNGDMFFVERPYTVDFIHIDDIGEQGFTRRPINDIILSPELQSMVTIIEPNRTNNLYVRNVYTMNVIPNLEKNYGYFDIVPELAHERLTGLEVATNREHIEKYIFPLWP